MSKHERGHTLVELLIALAVGGVLLTLAWNAVDYARRTVALVSATSELRALFQNTRAIAIAHRRNVAIRFRQDGDSWTWRVYEDRDNDGVATMTSAAAWTCRCRRRERSSTSRRESACRSETIIDPTNREPLASRLPVRFGTSQLCAFSREGESSNGSIVLTDGRNVRIIQIEGHSALIHVLRWDGSKWTTTS